MRLCFRETGKPGDVLRLEETVPTDPVASEVAVRMMLAPVHPADLNFIEGVYGRKPVFPAVPGNEGCGRVVATGPEARSLQPGDLVVPLSPLGSWSEHLVAPERDWMKVDPALDPAQAAMLRINPATALHLLRGFRSLQPGDWVAQNAANSAVGRAVIQLAREHGWRTLNFVRRPELAGELLALGATAVFPDDDAGLAAAKDQAADRSPRLALNAVGGDSSLRLMQLLAPGGAHVTYGAMSRRSLKIPNGLLIFKDIEVRGCWITREFERASPGENEAMLRSLERLMLDGRLRLPVDQIFPLGHWREALARAEQGGRPGKVLLSLGDSD